MRQTSLPKDLFVPAGPLFYPCCGDDTLHPLSLLLDRISEFHFADVAGVHLPNSNPLAKGYFVSSQQKIDQEYVSVHCPLGDIGYIAVPVNKIIQTWTVQASKQQDVKVVYHQLDGMLALLQLPEIAVFYYRGDSRDQGGSGQSWLGEVLFSLVLEKLLDRGLLITDGSNFCTDSANVPWKNLWTHADCRLTDDLAMPDDFTCLNRYFSCVSRVGNYYGPVYVWQVTQIEELD